MKPRWRFCCAFVTTFVSVAATAAAPAGAAEATVSVTAARETEPVASADDAADDPAIWRNRRRPAASRIVATDKKAGLHVFDLAGKRLSFTPAPRLNNVDLRDGVAVGGREAVLVVASDRSDPAAARLAFFRLDPAAGTLAPLGRSAPVTGEAYGLCLWRRRDAGLHAFLVLKDGRIDQFAIAAGGTAPVATLVRSLRVGSQAEGCVVDDRTGQLYVAEEDVGIWRFDADAGAPGTAHEVARVDGSRLTADVEGLALAPRGRRGGWLVASSQGDNAYAVYRLPDLVYAGRFRIAAGAVGAVSETDGIDLVPGDFGPDFRSGLLVAQDGDNLPAPQNFKLVDWGRVVRALKAH